MHELTLWGADRQWIRFRSPPSTGNQQAWAYWHGWTSEILAFPAGPINFMVNLTLGLGPTRILEQLRSPVELELADLEGKRLLAGKLQRGKAGSWWRCVCRRC